MPAAVGHSETGMPVWEPVCRLRAGPSRPRLINPAQMRKKCCYDQEMILGQYSSLSLSPIISHTQQNIYFSKINVRDLYFCKEVYSFVIEVVIISWLCSRVYICIRVVYTRMLRAILNKSWRQHPTRHQLYGHLRPITKTIQVRRTRHAGHCWRSRDELISDVLLWTPTNGRAKTRRPARIYNQQLCEDTGCCPEDLPEAMNDREKWRERVRDIHAASTTWWWWYCTTLRLLQTSTGSIKFISVDITLSLSLSLSRTHTHTR